MKQVQSVPRKRVLTSALLIAMAGPAWAQQADPQSTTPPSTTATEADPTTLDTVVVKGIRASLQSSMNLKRDAQGVVDGIVAEDIGKFPDTNLAESLQRISGVSIDRSNTGEGAMRAAVEAARLASHGMNRALSGKLEAETLLVANERTRQALPAGVRGRVIEFVENGVDLAIWRPPTTRPTSITTATAANSAARDADNTTTTTESPAAQPRRRSRRVSASSANGPRQSTPTAPSSLAFPSSDPGRATPLLSGRNPTASRNARKAVRATTALSVRSARRTTRSSRPGPSIRAAAHATATYVPRTNTPS